MLTQTIASLSASPITTIFDRATSLREQGVDLIDFSVGEPDFDTPKHICDAAINAIHQGQTRYTASDGTSSLKDAIARKFLRDNNLEFRREEIVVGAGAKPLLATAIQAVLGKGDEVLISTPAWASHVGMIEVCGATPVFIETGIKDGFKMTLAGLEAAVTPKTRLLLFCSPSNPTGAVYSNDALNQIAEFLRKNPKILVISDDLYEHIVFDGQQFVTLATVAPDLKQRILTVNGVSKVYAMTGWRIGFAGGPLWWTDGIRSIFSQTNGGPCSISQIAATAGLDGPQEFLADWRERYSSRRDLALNALSGIEGLSVSKPEGAFYLYPHCGELLGRSTPSGSLIDTSQDLAAYFLENGVVVVPGSGFFCDPYFRMSIATSKDQIKKGIKKIETACVALK